MTPADRLAFAADCGEKVHPGYTDNIEAGRQCGKLVKEALPNGGKYGDIAKCFADGVMIGTQYGRNE